jgi:hypothetical protein
MIPEVPFGDVNPAGRLTNVGLPGDLPDLPFLDRVPFSAGRLNRVTARSYRNQRI